MRKLRVKSPATVSVDPPSDSRLVEKEDAPGLAPGPGALPSCNGVAHKGARMGVRRLSWPWPSDIPGGD
jgi:hypothetical protein